MTDNTNTLRPRTLLVHGGTTRSHHGEMSEALYLTQGFAYDTAEAAEARFLGEDPGFIYARYGNPTVRMFEERVMALEGAEDAFATASGMAAVNAALFCQLKAGDHVVAAKALFGSCLYILETLLPRFGVECTFVEGSDLDAWRDALRPSTKCALIESPSNPTLEMIDIAAVAEIVHSVGAKLIVDNVFATPVFQRPLALGADIVLYSATKHIDGQGRCLGGIVLGTKEFIRGLFDPYMKHTGGALSPFNAWVMLKGMETLDLRCRAQAATAAVVADALAAHPRVTKVIYPGRADHPQHELAKRQMETGGTMVAFELEGGKDAAFAVMNALKVILISNNLGDSKSIITHPTTTTHQRLSEEQRLGLGITGGLLRMSCGLEDPQDLIDDLTRALDAN